MPMLGTARTSPPQTTCVMCEDIMSYSMNDNLSLYNEYNKTLRAWLVGFGISVPALFIINTDAQDLLANSAHKCSIIYPFLIGVSAQILIAFVNKIVAWCAYRREECSESSIVPCMCVRLFASIENWFLLDVIFDIVTLVAFGMSLVNLLRLYNIIT